MVDSLPRLALRLHVDAKKKRAEPEPEKRSNPVVGPDRIHNRQTKEEKEDRHIGPEYWCFHRSAP